METNFICSTSPTKSHLVLSLNKFSVLDVIFHPNVHFKTFINNSIDPELKNLDNKTLKLMQIAYTIGMNQTIDRIAHQYLTI